MNALAGDARRGSTPFVMVGETKEGRTERQDPRFLQNKAEVSQGK